MYPIYHLNVLERSFIYADPCEWNTLSEHIGNVTMRFNYMKAIILFKVVFILFSCEDNMSCILIYMLFTSLQ